MELSEKTVAFIGCGNMAEALIRGLITAKVLRPEKIIGTTPDTTRLEHMKTHYGISVDTDNCSAVKKADITVVAVKPQICQEVVSSLRDSISQETLVISVAAGISITHLAKWLGEHQRIIRAMPNTPALVGKGATALSFSDGSLELDQSIASQIFSSVGLVTCVDESMMDAVTGLSGSGPAYVFMIVEALADAGVKVGLPRNKAQVLAAQTVLGAVQLLMDTGEHPGVLKDRVTSPGGTAITGLHTLEEGGLRTTLINAVAAATARSRELGQEV